MVYHRDPMVAPCRLYTLQVSPWSERARWMLDHHGLAYREMVHLPMLGEGRLRRLAKRERITVPLLDTGEDVIVDSWDIARWADRTGPRERLIAPALEEQVAEWNKLTEPVMHAVRLRVLRAMLDDPGALDDAAPPFLPRALRPLGRPATRMVVRYLVRKYDSKADRELLVPYLERVRSAISSGYILGTFSYADIIVASFLQAIAPVDNRFWKIGHATRRLWADPELAERYADLVAWRDQVYERHRRRADDEVQGPRR